MVEEKKWSKGRGLRVKMNVYILVPLIAILGAFTYYNVKTNSEALEEALITKGNALARAGASSMAQVFESAISSGRLTKDQVFDTKYQPFDKMPDKDGTELVMYHTAYDAYLDDVIRPIEDEIQKDSEVTYAVLVDRNDYVPVHNTIFSQNVKDPSKNRSKRIFKDAIGLKAASNPNREAPLRQVYKRDTGETMWDISFPVYVKGEHWGGFRVGFSMEKMEKKVAAVVTRTLISMGVICVLIVGILLFISGQVARPLEKATAVMEYVAQELDLFQRLEAKSKDEVGRLAQSFNFLMDTFSGVIKKISESSVELSQSSQKVGEVSDRVVKNASAQAERAKEVLKRVETMGNTAREVASHAESSKVASFETNNAIKEVSAGTREISESAGAQNKQSQDTSIVIQAMGETAKMVQETSKQ